ncbi:MAG: hypothetical protein HYY06_06575 [Deltaproteobacteria bacterium]|nr:hypothetical protein [Deltaproteobacteria bacterium]
MKTTIELPDRLFRSAKAAAAARGVSLKQYFTEAVERTLREREHPSRPSWKNLSGRLKGLRAETARLDRLVEAEFERIDTEDNP